MIRRLFFDSIHHKTQAMRVIKSEKIAPAKYLLFVEVIDSAVPICFTIIIIIC